MMQIIKEAGPEIARQHRKGNTQQRDVFVKTISP